MMGPTQEGSIACMTVLYAVKEDIRQMLGQFFAQNVNLEDIKARMARAPAMRVQVGNICPMQAPLLGSTHDARPGDDLKNG